VKKQIKQLVSIASLCYFLVMLLFQYVIATFCYCFVMLLLHNVIASLCYCYYNVHVWISIVECTQDKQMPYWLVAFDIICC